MPCFWLLADVTVLEPRREGVFGGRGVEIPAHRPDRRLRLCLPEFYILREGFSSTADIEGAPYRT